MQVRQENSGAPSHKSHRHDSVRTELHISTTVRPHTVDTVIEPIISLAFVHTTLPLVTSPSSLRVINFNEPSLSFNDNARPFAPNGNLDALMSIPSSLA